MAIVEMTKLRLVGLKSEQPKVMDVLTRSGVFEPCPTAAIDGTENIADTSHLDKVLARAARLSFAIDCLTSANIEATRVLKRAKKSKAPRPFDYTPYKNSGGRTIVTYDDFYDCSAKEYELLARCDELEKLSFARAEARSDRTKATTKLKSLLPYSALPLPFSAARETERSEIIIALALSRNASLDKVKSTAPIESATYPCEHGTAAALICLKSNSAAIKTALAESGWSVCPFRDDKTAAELITEAQAEIAAADKADSETLIKILAFERYLLEFKTLYDFLGTDAEKFRAELDFQKTQSTYVLEGWIPHDYASDLAAEVKSKTGSVVVYLVDPTESDTPPTLLDNPKVVRPFESITNMYSTPSYREKDPNLVMAIFFFIIFGMMMADAGYGLVLAIACTFIVRFTHMEKGIKNLAGVFAMGGLSTIIFGALFGSWFGFALLPPLWFNPLEEPMMLLASCLVLGAIHLMVGYGYQAYYLIKKRKVLDAIFDVGFLYTMFIGIGLLALGMLLDSAPVLGDIGLYMLLGSLVAIFLTAGRHKKGVIGKITGGFGGLYGLVNLFSDVLSYARIFGIALAGGAIASAFNSILGVLAVSPFTIPIAILLGVLLHVFNLLISLLGAYVHNARLQFLEFYGKFYTGEGRLFTPMGERTKYIRFS